jgi:hypothetical protein
MILDAPAGAGADLRSWRRVSVDCPECSYDGHTVIMFDPSSGETHFLSPLPNLVLAHLSVEYLAFGQLIQELAGESPDGLGGDSLTAIAATLDFLEGAELVESQVL